MRSRSRPRRLRIVALSLVLLSTAIPSLAAIAAAASGGVRAGLYRLASAPAIPASAFDLGGTSSDQTVDLSITLTSADPAGLTQAAEEISDPTSPEYGQFLTTEQATSLYGPNPAQAATVTSWLEGQGLDVGSALGDGLVLPVEGTASQVASAFDTSLSNYWLSSGRLAYANTASPEIPSALASSIQSVIGLNTFVQLGSDTEALPAHRAFPAKTAKAATNATVRPLTGLQTASAPTPCSQFVTDAGNASNADTTQFVSHYDIGPLYTDNYTGSGITVALLEGGEEYSTNDVAAFNNCYGTSTSVTAVPVDGGCTSSCTTVGVESTMDIETVMGFAPGATIDVLQAPDLSDASLLADEAEAVSLDAQTVSASLGDCEPEAESDSGFMSSESTQFQLMATQGQTMFASSGDWGSQACLTYDDGTHSDPSFLTQLAVSDPGSQPWVTGVGGTTINNPSTPSTASESVWNEGPETDWSGNLVDTGGISDMWTMPSWQVGFDSSGNSSGIPCGASQGSYCREVPDVSATANPNSLGYLFVINCPSTSIATCSSDRDIDVAGGTSFGSPFWAALTALADQGAGTTHRLGFLNPALYRADTADPSVFNDVTSGNDNYLYPATGSPSNVYRSSAGYTCTYGGVDNQPCYEATAGYDMATGLGSPFAGPLFEQLEAVPLISTSTMPQATNGTSYSSSISVSPSTGASPFTWTASGTNQLPSANLSLSSAGVISGTPNSVGAFTFNAKVTDYLGNTATKALSVTVNAVPAITTSSTLPTGSIGNAYPTTTLANSGGTAPFTWSVLSGSLPSGLTLSAAGVLSGTPTAAYASSFTAEVTDANGAVASKTLSITVTATPAIAPATLPAATMNASYSQNLSVVSGTGVSPFTWAVTLGSLPTGITLGSSSGILSGTPTTGTSSFTVQVTDDIGDTGSQALALTVNAAPSITTSSSLTNGSVGNAYPTATLTNSGGTAPFTWSVLSGSLPSGLTLSSAGVLSGTPTAAYASSFIAEVTDANGAVASKSLSLNVTATPRISTASLPAATAGTPYNETLGVASGTTVSPLVWAIASGALPTGIGIGSGTGVLSGTPAAAGVFNFTAEVTDHLGDVGTSSLAITVNPAPSVSTGSIPSGTVGSSYSTTLQVAGGTAPLSWSVASGSLPSGISLSSSGVLSGQPNSSGSFTVQVTDANGAVADESLSLNVASVPAIATSSLPVGTVGVAYSTGLSESGGVTPVSWSLQNGSALPPGLGLGSNGVISGTPTGAGDTIFTVGIIDGDGQTTTATLAIVVTSAPAPLVSSSPIVTPSPAKKLTVSKSESGIVASPTSVAANGTDSAVVTITLRTASGSTVSGRAVSLRAQSGSSKMTVVSRTTNNRGVATFSVTDAVVQAVTYSATDTSDGIALKSAATVHFTKPPPVTPRSVVVSATRSSFGVAPATVRSCPAAGGQSVITAVLRSASGAPISGRTVVVVKPGSFKGSVSPSSATTNSSGSVTFTLTDKVAQTVAFGARDTTNNVFVAGSKAVTFAAKRC